MLKRLEGTVRTYRAVTKRNVQFELEGVSKIIDLTVSESWVINRGDLVVVVGEEDKKTGKFIAYVYRNKTKHIFGRFEAGVIGGYFFVVMGILFCWAIFPLFTHVLVGLRAVALDKKVSEAEGML